LVSDIPAGDGNIEMLFLWCTPCSLEIRNGERVWEEGGMGNISGWKVAQVNKNFSKNKTHTL
jgi:hypothetical protein